MKREYSAVFGIFPVLALFALSVEPAWAAGAKGTLTVEGKTVEITQAYAYATPGFFDKNKQDVVVLMCDAPLTAETVRDVFGLDKLISTDKLHCVQQTINTEKQVINFEVRHKRFSMPVGGGSSFHIFESKEFGDSTVSGRARTTAPQKSFDDIPYSYDITFRATFDPLPGERTGKKLPADGGEPWKSYLADNAKIRSSGSMGIAEIRKAAPPGELDATSDDELKTLLELTLAMTPENPAMTKGYVSGDRGILYITGMFKKQIQYGTIEMEKKDGEWSVVNSSWSGTPP